MTDRWATRIWMSSSLRLLWTLWFGAVVPIGCLLFAPNYAFAPIPFLMIQVVIGVEVVALLVWMRLKRPAEFFGGVFAAGSIIASLFAIFVTAFGGSVFVASAIEAPLGRYYAALDGVRAFLCLSTPLTALLYMRCTLVAFQSAQDVRLIRFATASLAGLVLVFVIPAGVYSFVRHEIDSGFRELYASTATTERGAIDRLRPYRRYVMRREFCEMYSREQDPTRKAKIAVAYRELKGGDIETADDSAPD